MLVSVVVPCFCGGNCNRQSLSYAQIEYWHSNCLCNIAAKKAEQVTQKCMCMQFARIVCTPVYTSACLAAPFHLTANCRFVVSLAAGITRCLHTCSCLCPRRTCNCLQLPTKIVNSRNFCVSYE